MVILQGQMGEGGPKRRDEVGWVVFPVDNDKRDNAARPSQAWVSADYLRTHLFPTFENSNLHFSLPLPCLSSDPFEHLTTEPTNHTSNQRLPLLITALIRYVQNRRRYCRFDLPSPSIATIITLLWGFSLQEHTSLPLPTCKTPRQQSGTEPGHRTAPPSTKPDKSPI